VTVCSSVRPSVCPARDILTQNSKMKRRTLLKKEQKNGVNVSYGWNQPKYSLGHCVCVFVVQYDSGNVIMVCGNNKPPVFTSAGRTVIVNLVVSPNHFVQYIPYSFSLTYKTACMYMCCSLCLLPARSSCSFYARKQLLLSARLSHRNSVCLSVRLSVTRVNQSKTVQARITKSLPSASFRNRKAFP